MSAEADSGWIEGEFEGIYSGEQRSRSTPHDPARARRFGFQLESGKLHAFEPSEAPGPELHGSDVIRQGRVPRIELPVREGDSAAGETSLFDVHISNWQLKHPAEAGGRAYGTIVGTLRARLRPQLSQPLPESEATTEPEAANELPVAEARSPAAAQPPPSRSSRVDPGDPNASFARLQWTLLVALLTLVALGIGYACSPRIAGIWLAPVVTALLVRRVTRGGGRFAWWTGVALCGLQLSLLWAPLQLAWQGGCWPPLGTFRLVGLGLPVVLAAGIGTRWPVWITGTLWTVVVCSWCTALGEGTCAVSPTTAGASVQEAPAARTDADGRWPAARTDADGRWPVMPEVAFPRASGDGGEHAGSEDRRVALPSASDLVMSPGEAPPSPQLPGVTAWPVPLDTSGLSGAEGDANTRVPEPSVGTASRSSSTEGGWVSPDHRRAPRELVLISIEQANRTPQLFFASAGTRRVYVPTDPIFDDASSRLRPKAELVLARVAALLSLPAQPRVVLEVHSDSAGALDHQISLSERRAAAIRSWLIERGHVDAGRFELAAVGGTRPLVPPDGDYGAQKPNRRIEIRLVESTSRGPQPRS